MNTCINLGLSNVRYASETQWTQILCAHNLLVAKSFRNFVQSMAVSLPCSVQDFKMIWQLKRMLWMNNHFARLWLIDIIWRQRFRSTLAQVMACYLVAPSQYLNQCWLIFSGMLWHSPQSDFMVSAQTTILYNEFEMIFFKFLPHFPEANELRRVSEAYPTLQLTPDHTEGTQQTFLETVTLTARMQHFPYNHPDKKHISKTQIMTWTFKKKYYLNWQKKWMHCDR